MAIASLIREFSSKDAEFCFGTRCNAFTQKFYDELGPRGVAAGVNAYMPADYIRMAEKMKLFIVEEDGTSIGFFSIKRIDEVTAEIPLIYFDLKHLGKGVGRRCVQFIEEWLRSNWKEVKVLIVDTVIPKYKAGFYKKLGFIQIKETFCDFPGLRVKALRLSKRLGS